MTSLALAGGLPVTSQRTVETHTQVLEVSRLKFGWKEIAVIVAAVAAFWSAVWKMQETVESVAKTQAEQSKQMQSTQDQVKELQRQIQLNQYDTRRLQEKVDDLTNAIRRRTP